MRWTWQRRRRTALSRTAKSCGPDAPTLASRSWSDPRTTVANKPGHRGERGGNRKTIARGMPGVSGVTVVTNARVYYTPRAAAGASGARHSLRPLITEGGRFLEKLAHACGGIARPCLDAAGCLTGEGGGCAKRAHIRGLSTPSFRGDAKHRTSDVRLHIGESRDSGSGACAPSRNDDKHFG